MGWIITSSLLRERRSFPSDRAVRQNMEGFKLERGESPLLLCCCVMRRDPLISSRSPLTTAGRRFSWAKVSETLRDLWPLTPWRAEVGVAWCPRRKQKQRVLIRSTSIIWHWRTGCCLASLLFPTSEPTFPQSLDSNVQLKSFKYDSLTPCFLCFNFRRDFWGFC